MHTPVKMRLPLLFAGGAVFLLGAAIVLLVFAIDRRITHAPKSPIEDTTGVPGDIL